MFYGIFCWHHKVQTFATSGHARWMEVTSLWHSDVRYMSRNKFQLNFNQNTRLFIHKNASENIVCEMAAISFNVLGPVVHATGDRTSLKVVNHWFKWWLGAWCTIINGLVQERRYSSALTMELRLSCTNPSNVPKPAQSYDTMWSHQVLTS